MRRLTALAVVVLALTAACGKESPTDLVAKGEQLYQGEATCATCHGSDLRGTTMGPPFLHEVYAPGHHPDAAFQRAVRNGVQPHHWQLGPMPPLPHLSADDVAAVTAYVRSQQREAGIE